MAYDINYKEVNSMPRRDGTGQMGAGTMTGRGFAINQTSSKTQEELLNEQKTVLQNRLEVIDKQLENL